MRRRLSKHIPEGKSGDGSSGCSSDFPVGESVNAAALPVLQRCDKRMSFKQWWSVTFYKAKLSSILTIAFTKRRSFDIAGAREIDCTSLINNDTKRRDRVTTHGNAKALSLRLNHVS